MKVYGALEAAQIEWFTNAGKPAASSYPFRVIYVTDLKQIQVSDGTNWNPSALYTYTAGTLPAAGASNQYQVAFITDTLQVKVSNGTEWKTIGARLDTYTSGTIPAAASNTNSIIWVSDLQQVQVSNGTAWVQVGSKAGTKNYFSQNNANSDFETNSVSPWSACTLTFSSGVPSGAPTLTATQMSIATTSTTPLSGTYSMQLTKAAANAQYQGFISGALTIDREDTAKVLYGSFYYEVVSGTIDLSGSSTQSLEIWIYNTVSGQWTQPAGYRGMNQSSGVGRVVFSFQTDGTYANNVYKIAVITQQTSTSAFVVEFDDFVVGPESIVLGAAMTDWQSYTPTFTGFGTASNIEFQWRRIGDSVQVKGKFTTGTGTATEARISLPAGMTSADTSKIPSIQIAGNWARATFASTLNNWTVLSEPSVSYVTFGYGNTTAAGALTKLQGTDFATSVAHSFVAQIPISGWGSFSQMSSDTDTRVVGASFRKDGTTQSIATGVITKVTYQTVDYDTHGGWNAANNRYYVPVSGLYYVSAIQQYSSAVTDNRVYVYKNGSLDRYLDLRGSITTATGSGSGLVQCNANDYLEIYTIQGSGGSVNLNGSSTSNCFQVFRLSGPSVITATETVAAKYSSTNGQSIGTADTLIKFETKEFDSTSSYGTSTGLFTAPVSGKYLIGAMIHSSLALTGSNSVTMSVFYNGASSSVLGRQLASSISPVTYTVWGSTEIHCNAGDTLSIYVRASVAGSLSTSAGQNNMYIVRVGN